MKRYIKEIDGKEIIKYSNKIIIIKNGFQIINPTEEMILEDGWTEYNHKDQRVELQLSEQELFDNKKQEIINNIYEYDQSSDVNICYINYQGECFQYWADKTERSVLKSVLNDYILNNIELYRLDLRELNVSIEIKCELLMSLLSKLEIYASKCYNVTTDHLYNITKITTIDELDNYNFKINYPEKLTFNV